MGNLTVQGNTSTVSAAAPAPGAAWREMCRGGKRWGEGREAAMQPKVGTCV